MSVVRMVVRLWYHVCDFACPPWFCAVPLSVFYAPVLWVQLHMRSHLRTSSPECDEHRRHGMMTWAVQEIPSRQTWSIFFPNVSYFDANIRNIVKDSYGWGTVGASIEYDYRATSREFSTPNYVVSPPTIQVRPVEISAVCFPHPDGDDFFGSCFLSEIRSVDSYRRLSLSIFSFSSLRDARQGPAFL
jgi:hypothetical protein